MASTLRASPALPLSPILMYDSPNLIFDMDFNEISRRIIAGRQLTDEEALALADIPLESLPDLWNAAERVTAALVERRFDTCSIVNARSGRCPEDCKWCAQSAHYATGADVYPVIGRERCLEAGHRSRSHGIGRFSLVTSGRAMRGAELEKACGHIKALRDEGGLGLCASMGLLGPEELRRLREAGVTRYHCNLETAPSFFGELCSTHTTEQKLATIEAARAEGLEICSGGIIGMGETRCQRVELALTLRRIDPVSIPINILCPIPGTPLQDASPLTEDEIVTTVALFRLIHPRVTLRFAGGRAALSREGQLRAIRAGINGAITGDMLTTTGSTVEADRKLAADAGLKF